MNVVCATSCQRASLLQKSQDNLIQSAGHLLCGYGDYPFLPVRSFVMVRRGTLRKLAQLQIMDHYSCRSLNGGEGYLWLPCCSLVNYSQSLWLLLIMDGGSLVEIPMKQLNVSETKWYCHIWYTQLYCSCANQPGWSNFVFKKR